MIVFNELRLLVKKWSTLFFVLLVALFPLYTMDAYFAGHRYLNRHYDVLTLSLAEDAANVRYNVSDEAFESLSESSQKAILQFADLILRIRESFLNKDYNQMIEDWQKANRFYKRNSQSGSETGDFMRAHFHDYDQLSLRLSKNAQYNVLWYKTVDPSNAMLFGDVGAIDYFCYFYMHNTYLVWILAILFKFDFICSMFRNKSYKHLMSSPHSRASLLKAKLGAHYLHFMFAYTVGLLLFLLGSSLFKGIGNVNTLVTINLGLEVGPIHIPEYLFVLVQFSFHALLAFLVLCVILWFSVRTQNATKTFVYTAATFFFLLWLVPSFIGPFDPLSYSDLVCYIRSGKAYHFRNPELKHLIKAQCSALKGLLCIVVPSILLIKFSCRRFNKQDLF